MPIPISEALEDQETSAITKARAARTSMARYLATSAMAGAYVGVAVVLLVMVSAAFVAAKSPSAKLVQGAVFGVALTLVVFAGAELFTGNVMVMLQGLMRRRVRALDVAVVWVASLLGNLAGSLLFAGLVNASGVLSAGAARGQQTVFTATLAGIVKSKAGLSGGQLFMRSILCNMLVCLALWMAGRTRSDAAKLICLWWALLAFIASGFEHSIANMTVFGLGIFGHVPLAGWSEMTRNLVFTVPGNVLGGGLLVGLAYGWAGRAEPVAVAPGASDTVAGVTALAREVEGAAAPRVDGAVVETRESVSALVTGQPG